MNSKRFCAFLALVITLLAAILPLERASADTGPKPTIEVTFQQDFEGDPVTIISGILLQCALPDCQDAVPLPGNMGPQNFTCEELTCSGLAYGFSDYGQLEITFSDGKVRRSNVFAITNFNSAYDAIIRQDDLVVKERFNPTSMIIAAVCLGALAIVVVSAVVLLRALRRKAQA